MNKTSRAFAKPLRDLLGKVVGEVFTRQGFASAELVTRWNEIVGAEISAHSEPIKIQWPRVSRTAASVAGARASESRAPESREPESREPEWGRSPGTLVLRVEGPAAVEIQHLADVICERVNRFLGWRAIARIALRQAPLRRAARKPVAGVDPAAVARIAGTLPEIADDDLRQALARLGAAVVRRR